ncbi:FtsX-like permease family protein [Sphingomonas prati]|uniref:Putative ABC transport system permease protein n=1 Tax=Sphingomonas prati TaxID=1843237 RepID=A0A7W9BUA7_9SPHN|nr:FtsX-like permease family protein [Sphingomonas prati]MBB5730257.1 putative ABC transport system permease protein [Sphingomonas prati]
MTAEPRSGGIAPPRALRWMILGEWRAHPARVITAALAIAVGVALGFAVHLINGSALDAFGQAVRAVNGAADLQVRAATPAGMDEALYPEVALHPGVADASPVVQLKATAAGADLTLLGLDILRAGQVTPALVGQPMGGPGSAFDLGALFLSRAALDAVHQRVGATVAVTAAGRTFPLRIAGVLPGVEAGRRIGVIDIAAAQWRFGRIGRIDRIDLKLAEGADAAAVRRTLATALPPAATLADADSDAQQGAALSRAYRVNLDMLALVALLTGGFLVYSAQSLSVTRRLRSFALLRTLGLPRAGIVVQVAIEGLVVGLVGTALGLAIGYALASVALTRFGGDLGAGYFGGVAPALAFAPGAALLFAGLGLAAALAGSIIPARAAARAAPAVALRNAGDVVDPRTPVAWRVPLALVGAGVVAALLPAIGGLPLFGYAAMALVLAGGVAAMPWAARLLLAPFDAHATGRPAFDLAIRHLRGAPGQAAVALGGIVASTALMIAMAVMVTSFRGAVDDWLGDILSADLYLRVDGSTGGFDPAAQTRLSAVPGVARIAFTRQVPLTLDPGQPATILIARPIDATLPLIGPTSAVPAGTVPVWLSEPASRLMHKSRGDTLALPIGRNTRFAVAGIWRDYARQQGAIAIDTATYSRLTGDTPRDEGAVTLKPGADPARVRRALMTAAPPALSGQVEVASPATLRAFALTLFDRSFAITYVLEAVAVLVGLAGVATTVSAQTIARIREFGMLRHIGAGRRQIVTMLGAEGALLGGVGGVAGIALGLGLSQILIHVVNPQSFNWTMTTRVPVPLIAGVAASLIVAAAATAMLAGRRAVAVDAVRAVREDW